MIGKVEETAANRAGEFSSPRTMLRVADFIDSLGIMKHSKQADYLDLGTCFFHQPKAVFQYSCPVGNAVRSVPWQGVVLQNRIKDWFEVHGD